MNNKETPAHHHQHHSCFSCYCPYSYHNMCPKFKVRCQRPSSNHFLSIHCEHQLMICVYWVAVNTFQSTKLRKPKEQEFLGSWDGFSFGETQLLPSDYSLHFAEHSVNVSYNSGSSVDSECNIPNETHGPTIEDFWAWDLSPIKWYFNAASQSYCGEQLVYIFGWTL